MARKLVTICDNCPPEEEVRADYERDISLDGQKRHLDLCHGCNLQWDAFVTQQSKWLDVSQPLDTEPTPSQERRLRTSRDPEVGKIRDWAKKNGHEVSERGRISAEVRAAYHAAMAAEASARNGHAHVEALRSA